MPQSLQTLGRGYPSSQTAIHENLSLLLHTGYIVCYNEGITINFSVILGYVLITSV